MISEIIVSMMSKMYRFVGMLGCIASMAFIGGMLLAHRLGNDQAALLLLGISIIYILITLTAYAMDHNKVTRNFFTLCISVFAFWYITVANVILFDVGEVSGLFAGTYHQTIFVAEILMLSLITTSLYYAIKRKEPKDPK